MIGGENCRRGVGFLKKGKYRIKSWKCIDVIVVAGHLLFGSTVDVFRGYQSHYYLGINFGMPVAAGLLGFFLALQLLPPNIQFLDVRHLMFGLW
jgi:hypothetical protein